MLNASQIILEKGPQSQSWQKVTPVPADLRAADWVSLGERVVFMNLVDGSARAITGRVSGLPMRGEIIDSSTQISVSLDGGGEETFQMRNRHLFALTDVIVLVQNPAAVGRWFEGFDQVTIDRIHRSMRKVAINGKNCLEQGR